MALVEMGAQNFRVNPEGITIIDWWAPWCAPCRAFLPVFHDVSEKHTDIVFGKVNVQEEQEAATEFQIQSVPTLTAIKNGVVVFHERGALPRAKLEGLIEALRKLEVKKK